MKTLVYAMPCERFDKIFPQDVLSRISRLCRVAEVAPPREVTREFLLSHVRDAQIVVTSWGTPMLDEEIVSAARGLELIAHAAGTVKPIVSDAAWRRGVRVTSAAPAIGQCVAEFCLGLILTIPKRVPWLAEQVRRGGWREKMDFFGPPLEIYKQNVGVIAASGVGRHLIRLLQPFGCNVLLYDPYCTAEEARALGATKVDSLDEIFSRCRVVSLNAPATEETKGMIRGRHFALFQPGSVFINTARGIIVNQDEMVAELRKGNFIACLDVTEPEPPPPDHELRRLPNVILTPHMAGMIADNFRRVGEFIADDIAAYTSGRPMKGEVFRDRLSIIA